MQTALSCLVSWETVTHARSWQLVDVLNGLEHCLVFGLLCGLRHVSNHDLFNILIYAIKFLFLNIYVFALFHWTILPCVVTHIWNQ